MQNVIIYIYIFFFKVKQCKFCLFCFFSGPSSSSTSRDADKEEMVAIFEEAAKKPAMPPPPLSGPELAAMMKVHYRSDW